MDIHDALAQLSLTAREARIYTSLLELGRGTPLSLSKKTGLKRPTIYLDLESLRRKQLAGLAFEGKKTVYIPESPQKLFASAQQQEKVALEILPMLRALENRGGTKPQIRYYDRVEDISRVWMEATFHHPENRFISHIKNLTELYGDLLAAYEQQLRRGEIKQAWEIVTATPADIVYAKKYNSKNRRIRIMPPNMKYDIDISMWGQNIGLYSMAGRYLVVITDPSISQAFRSIFDLIWSISKEPRQFMIAPKKPRTA
ncbi:MAG: hypothetical protein HYY50_00635 [Candidatus Kerfeldbacteria bacterium]|nr:hypothetical protein [Candidatus Kerfeldbacteria bacterium]